MATEFQREQQERRETLQNDARLREQQQHGSTYMAHAIAEADTYRGRYSGQEHSEVIGRDLPLVAAPNWAHDPAGVEAPLGYAVDAPPEPCGTPTEIERSIRQLGETGVSPGPPEGGAVEAPASLHTSSADAVELAAPSTSNTDNPDDEPPPAA